MKKFLFACCVTFMAINSVFADCDGQSCAIQPVVGDAEKQRCSGKNAGEVCAVITGEKYARCIDNVDRNGNSVVSCAAKECTSDYALWSREINGRLVPWGRCKSKASIESDCERGCVNCFGDNKKCVPRYVSNPNPGYGGDAFEGGSMCVCRDISAQNCETKYANLTGDIQRNAIRCCKDKEAGLNVEWDATNNMCKCVGADNGKTWVYGANGGTCVEGSNDGNCIFTFRAKTVCPNGQIATYEAIEPVKRGNVCPDTFDELITQYTTEFNALLAKYCSKTSTVTTTVTDNTALGNAKMKLEAFKMSVDGKASVWRNEEGKFNTARLASDLTAGVVLGTVGGVVSGVVIKKKQVEKGFDALHCTVGGQKVADWGDEFSVGFRR